MTDAGYWTVKLEAFAFDTEEAAKEYRNALLEAFMAMPESDGIASRSSVDFVGESEND